MHWIVLVALGACGRSGLLPKDSDGGAVDLAPPAATADLAHADGPTDLAQPSCAAATPSRHTVHVTVENDSAGDRWLITQGEYCDPFSVSNLTLSLGYVCGCECAAPPPAGAKYYVHLASGQSTSFDWDARALDDCTMTIDCSAQGWTQTPPVTIPAGQPRPVPAGAYAVTVAYERSAPSMPGCVQLTNGDYQCYPPAPRSAGSPPATSPASICPSGATVHAPFSVPPSGAVSVTVSINTTVLSARPFEESSCGDK
jgi:hypothetical protein